MSYITTPAQHLKMNKVITKIITTGLYFTTNRKYYFDTFFNKNASKNVSFFKTQLQYWIQNNKHTKISGIKRMLRLLASEEGSYGYLPHWLDGIEETILNYDTVANHCLLASLTVLLELSTVNIKKCHAIVNKIVPTLALIVKNIKCQTKRQFIVSIFTKYEHCIDNKEIAMQSMCFLLENEVK